MSRRCCDRLASGLLAVLILCSMSLSAIANLPSAREWGGFPERALRCGKCAQRQTGQRVDSLHAWDALRYDLELQLDTGSQWLSGRLQLEFAARVPLLDTLDLHLEGFSVDSARQGDALLPVVRSEPQLLLPLGEVVAQGGSSRITIWYQGVPPQRDGLGMMVQNQVLWTVSDPWGTRLWVPCYDEPHDKALWNVTVRLPATQSALSNGELQQVEDHEDGTRSWIYRHASPLSTYLLSVVAGNHVIIEESWNELPLRWLVYPHHVDEAEVAFSRVDQMFDCFTGLWGEYPFRGYAMGEAPIYGGLGGMEHQTCTTIGHGIVANGLTYESIVAHELAHQWWGDSVTPVDFRQVWMNEGWATYSEAYYYQHLDSGEWSSFVEYMRQIHQTYLGWDSEYLPIFAPPLNNLFNISQYEKAASVLHMLRLLMGEEDFHQAQRTWLAEQSNGTVDTWEYIAAMEAASGQELDWFFDQWIFSGGYPRYRTTVQWQPQGDSSQVYLAVAQEHQVLESFNMPVPVRVQTDLALLDTLLRIDQDWQDHLLTLPGVFDTLIFNHDSWILCRHEAMPPPPPFELVAERILLDDSAGGNGDGDLAQGESASLALGLRNLGEWRSAVQVTPASSDLELTGVWPEVASWGAGETIWLPTGFVEVTNSTLPQLGWAEVALHVQAAGEDIQDLVAQVPVGDPWLLLVQHEDLSVDLMPYYQEELDSLRLHPDHVLLADLPAESPLQPDHQAALWFTGDAGLRIPAEQLESRVNSWVLDEGASLLISGQDALDELLAQDLHGAGVAATEAGQVALDGEPGTNFEGLSALLLGTGGAANQVSPSALEDRSGSQQWTVLARYRNSGAPALLAREVPESGGRLMMCGFGIEGISGMANTSSRREWLWQIAVELGGPELPVTRKHRPRPASLSLGDPRPNPFNPVTGIPVELTRPLEIRLRAYDLAGRLQKTLASGHHSAGSHLFTWQAGQAAAGLYLIELTGSDGSRMVRKVLLLK